MEKPKQTFGPTQYIQCILFCIWSEPVSLKRTGVPSLGDPEFLTKQESSKGILEIKWPKYFLVSLVRSHRWLKARPGVEPESPNCGPSPHHNKLPRWPRTVTTKMCSWIVVKMLLISFKCYKCNTGAHGLPAPFSQNK